MARDLNDEQVISSRDELVGWLEDGCKPEGPFRIGTEHEKIPFYRADCSPLPYDGRPELGGAGVRALLEGLQAASGWEPIEDAGALIGLYDPAGGGAISLEPGGQFELSGAPLDDVHQTRAELDAHFAALAPFCERFGVDFLDLGMSPLWRREETPVMPKQRYRIMARYMPSVGGLGLDMMFRTSTVQTNLDFASEADMVAKMRLALSLQPLFTALFANSPFTDGKPNGFLSMRSQIWTDTDPDRTGMLPFVFEPGMGFERYVDYALDVPMYFVKRGDVYHDVAGASFRDLLAGKLPQLPGEFATISDWANHLSTIFPEVRLKRYMEMRGADVGPRAHILAFTALCGGLCYDREASAAAWDLVKDFSAQDRDDLRKAAPRTGLAAKIRGRSLLDLARDIMPLARAGLERRMRLDQHGRDETQYLAVLEEIAATGENLAQKRLALYHGAWKESVLPAFRECIY
ncbi:glutamate--cysteine ligase [Rhodoblastus acidophilus]|uniref:Glutamate--cysteine ligase n=1 Tax=Candidatus Rhodoblastus alkanivorans TaxID=2954117 RepID=A0ABS9ZAJ5_9HYPH|nr:glutamate--cysteine ligase [Candidatus Rhodoblastus alkanivorans]MCI4677787.1 glutamate--cysteine ligase [Candidatus Rhodoblastus alkanivorans]MCI4684715.1 glutamate--cysteine ligase [Candidatus Rhodoblastus alkanivorans]MDI4642037.1 glutamate--cysteine ligase [Rhodoblastus acidophilus]